VQFAAVTSVSILATVLVGATLGEIALRRSAAGKRVSGSSLGITAMVVGALLYLTLAFWIGTLVGVAGVS
jgi:hypothetical protein